MSPFKSCIVLCVFAAVVASAFADVSVDLLNSINELDQEQSLKVAGGLVVERVANAGAAPRSGSESVVERVERYLNQHEIKFGGFDSEDNQVEEARSSKLKKILLPLLLVLKLKMAIILPIVLKAITLISLKGLAIGTIALLFSGATFVKDLLAKKQEHITTAYISGAGAPPVNAEFVHHHGNEWNRNGQAASAQDLAYNYHTLPQFV